MTIGWSKSPLTKATSTSSSTSGSQKVPRSLPRHVADDAAPVALLAVVAAVGQRRKAHLDAIVAGVVDDVGDDADRPRRACADVPSVSADADGFRKVIPRVPPGRQEYHGPSWLSAERRQKLLPLGPWPSQPRRTRTSCFPVPYAENEAAPAHHHQQAHRAAHGRGDVEMADEGGPLRRAPGDPAARCRRGSCSWCWRCRCSIFGAYEIYDVWGMTAASPMSLVGVQGRRRRAEADARRASTQAPEGEDPIDWPRNVLVTRLIGALCLLGRARLRHRRAAAHQEEALLHRLPRQQAHA